MFRYRIKQNQDIEKYKHNIVNNILVVG